MKSQSLWLIKKNKPRILSKDIFYKKNDKTVLVKTLYSGVSKGTESLVTSGKVHKSQFEIMKCPFQDGSFSFPIKYGYINIGQIIERGEPLGLIADEEYALRLDELRNAIASQQAQVDFLQSESVRLESLKNQNLTSGTALDKNKADLKAATADLAQAKSRLQQIENDISNLTPKAPFKGFVTEQLAQPGQFLNDPRLL